MTRKDYVKLAAALADSRPTKEDFTKHSFIGDNTFFDGISYEAALAQWRADLWRIARALATANWAFDRNRFYAAAEQ